MAVPKCRLIFTAVINYVIQNKKHLYYVVVGLFISNDWNLRKIFSCLLFIIPQIYMFIHNLILYAAMCHFTKKVLEELRLRFVKFWIKSFRNRILITIGCTVIYFSMMIKFVHLELIMARPKATVLEIFISAIMLKRTAVAVKAYVLKVLSLPSLHILKTSKIRWLRL